MNIRILFFSGTGNTLIIAQRMAKRFETFGENVRVNIQPIEDFRNQPEKEPSPFSDDLLGLAYPVYDLQPPEIVLNFLKDLPSAKKPIPVFIFSTEGLVRLDCNTHASSILAQKNFFTIAKTGFKAPAPARGFYNYPERFPNPLFYRFGKNTAKKIDRFCQKIFREYLKFQKKPFKKIGLFFPGNKLIQKYSLSTFGEKYYKDLKVDSNCSACGICVKKCPVNNLIIEKGQLIIKKDNGCLRCLRCIQLCPQSAINFTSSKRTGSYFPETVSELFKKVCP